MRLSSLVLPLGSLLLTVVATTLRSQALSIVPAQLRAQSLQEEIGLLHAAGLSRAQALSAATNDAAACMGGKREFGTIRVGMRADLLLLASNPLEHLSALAAPVGVMARGRWLPAAQLEKQMRVR